MFKSEFNTLYKLILENTYQFPNNQLYIKNILREQNQYWNKIFLIDPEMLITAINNNAQYFFDSRNDNILNEKEQQQTYLTQFLQDVEIQTKNFNYSTMFPADIEKLFINFTEEDFSNLVPVYIQFFDFSNLQEKSKIFQACSNIKNINLGLQLHLNQTANGCCVDLRQFGVKAFLLFFNTLSYTRRTIYHEWTHYLQKTCGENFKYIIQNSEQTQKNINIKLKNFGFTKQSVLNYFFKPNEYITQIDNLIFAIKETWKKYYLNEMTKQQFCQLVINTFKTTKKSILNSQLYLNFKNTNKAFQLSIKFLICIYICYKNTEYINLCRVLKEHF